jgi:hypothetical protein
MLEWKEPGVIAESGGSGIQKKLDFDEVDAGKYLPYSSTPPSPPTPPPPPSAREQKRPKKQATPKKDRKSGTSAGSGNEHRREQCVRIYGTVVD